MPVHFSLKAPSFRPWATRPSHSETDAGSSGQLRFYSSPERFRADVSGSGHLDHVPEDGIVDFGNDDEDDDEEELEEQLEAQGLYRGSYRRLLVLYSLAPLAFVMAFTFLALLPTWAYRLQVQPKFPLVLPFPLTEFFVSAGLWSLCYLLHGPIYRLSVLVCSIFRLSRPSFATILSTILNVTLSLLLRLIAIPVLLIPCYLLYEAPTWHDPAFRRVWWVALGWAAVEAVVTIKQGYDNIALYRDVLVDDMNRHENEEQLFGVEDGGTNLGRIYSYGVTNHAEPPPASSRDTSPQNIVAPSKNFGGASAPDARVDSERAPLLQRSSYMSNEDLEASLELQVNEDLERLMTVKARDDLEEYYGIPFIRIPVFIACLQRANALLFSLGITPLLSFAYLKSNTLCSQPEADRLAMYAVAFDFSPTLSLETINSPIQLLLSRMTLNGSNKALQIVLPVAFLLQLLLSVLHSQLVLPKAGVHTVVYIGSLVSLGTFFAGLGTWNALS